MSIDNEKCPSCGRRDRVKTCCIGKGAKITNTKSVVASANPTPMILTCPSCNGRHIDEGEFATKPHHTHACQHCGIVWRPAIVPTVGVQFLPGFKS